MDLGKPEKIVESPMPVPAVEEPSAPLAEPVIAPTSPVPAEPVPA